MPPDDRADYTCESPRRIAFQIVTCFVAAILLAMVFQLAAAH
jgi:hypothetical protein